MLKVTYGGQAATAHVVRRDWGTVDLSVSLDSDPGYGSMFFGRISPSEVEIISGDTADLRSCAAYLNMSARFVTDEGTRDRLQAQARAAFNLALQSA